MCQRVVYFSKHLGIFINVVNRKKFHRAKSGAYGGWAMITVLFLAKNSWRLSVLEQPRALASYASLTRQLLTLRHFIHSWSTVVTPGILLLNKFRELLTLFNSSRGIFWSKCNLGTNIFNMFQAYGLDITITHKDIVVEISYGSFLSRKCLEKWGQLFWRRSYP